MRRLFGLLALAGMVGGLSAQSLPVPRFTDPARRARLEKAFPAIEKIFEQYRQERRIPGLVFGVVIDADLAHVKGLGVRDVGSQDPVTPDTVFRIASMTKSFTSAAILKLRDEGKLSLDDPVSKWVPEFGGIQYPTRDTDAVRVRQLLTHGTGLPEDNPWGDRQLHRPEQTMTAWLKAGLPFSTPPDTAYEYSNYGFALAGRVIAKASGRTYQEYLELEILSPLGMKVSTLEPSKVPQATRAIGYRRDGERYQEEKPLAHGAFGAMGGLFTSARDLGRYVAWQLAAFPPRDDADAGPVRRSSRREMQRMWRTSGLSAVRAAPDAPLRASARGYGYGLGISQDCRFEHIVGHGGGLPGYGSYMMWLPEYGVGVFFMANLTYAGSSAVADDAFEALRQTGGLEKRKLPPAPVLVSMRDDIVRLWREWDDADASKLAADNLFLDLPAEARRDEIRKLKGEVGECREFGEVEPENLLRGAFRMSCERGFVDVTFTLAPTLPPTVQFLRFSATKPPDARIKSVLQTLASQVGSASEDLRGVSAPSLDTAKLRGQLDALRVLYGACRLGEAVGGNGSTEAVVRFDCDRGPLDVVAHLTGDARLSHVSFNSPRDAVCAP